MTKASDLFIQCLEEEGVEYIFGVPGEENLAFLDSLSRSTKIKLILTRHEQGAGFMAATYGRHTGKAGVSLATLGPGATNLVTAGAYAQLGGMPMMMITGQKPIKSSKQGRFQILEVVDMMRPLTKFTPSDAFRRQYPLAGARGHPPGAGGKARRGAYRIPRRHRRGGERFHAAEGEPGAPAGSRREGSARRRGPHRARQIAASGDRRRRQPRHDQPHADPVRGKDRHPLCHHPAGQGRDRRAQSEIRGLCRAVIGRFRPCRRRRRRRDRQYRP